MSDQGDPKRYWTQIPNIVLEILNPLELTLYVHLKRAAGDNGRCTKSRATLARETGMGAGTVSRTKESLAKRRPELKNKPLIIIKNIDNPSGGKPYQEITITDIWLVNTERFTPSSVDIATSSVDEQRPDGAEATSRATSTVDIKKNSNKNLQEEQRDFLSELKTDPVYSRLDVSLEFGKAQRWAAANHRRVTQRMFVNWLNRSLSDLPLNGNGAGSYVDVELARAIPPERIREMRDGR